MSALPRQFLTAVRTPVHPSAQGLNSLSLREMELFELTTGVEPHSNKPSPPLKPACSPRDRFRSHLTRILANKQTPTCDRDRRVTTATYVRPALLPTCQSWRWSDKKKNTKQKKHCLRRPEWTKVLILYLQLQFFLGASIKQL